MNLNIGVHVQQLKRISNQHLLQFFNRESAAKQYAQLNMKMLVAIPQHVLLWSSVLPITLVQEVSISFLLTELVLSCTK